MKKDIFNKIIFISWFLLGLSILFIQKENPSKIEYACIWICFLLEKMENMGNKK
jgi:hypothetical protein